ncbi:MAG: eukaryotic-like serine/threonine-protein kinase [Verrucomicrobiota bacterium]
MRSPAEIHALWTKRLPETRRMNEFYRKLDSLIPNWPLIVRARDFTNWMMEPDSENGSRMFDRLHSLWDDPFFGAQDFAALLRLAFSDNYSVQRVAKPVLGGKYEIISHLGTGGNGTVYLVWSNETSTLYALKTIRADVASDVAARNSFRAEANTWISLGDHPNLAKAHYYEEVDGELYITMSYVEAADSAGGASLADEIAAGRITDELLCVWFCQVADGLNYAYANGVKAHRDIKPGNILVGREVTARLSDFGLAVFTEELVATSNLKPTMAGTPLFMAPEQFGEDHYGDQRSDIYSLGVSLYYAASGKLPFVPRFTPVAEHEMHRYLVEVRDLHLHGTAAPIRSALWPVIIKCLAKRPDARFGTVSEFRSAVETVARRIGVRVPSPAKVEINVWTLRDQGNSLMRLGRYDDALALFDEFLKVFPGDGVVLNRAVCLENTGRYSEAFAVYERLAEAGEVAGLVNGSNCLRVLGRTEESFDYAKRAVALEQKDVQSWIALGNAAYNLGHWENAIDAYLTARSLAPSNPTPPYNLAIAAERAGQVNSAKEAYRAFLQLSAADDKRRAIAERRISLLVDSSSG